MKILLYCTKKKPDLYVKEKDIKVNGKIVGVCDCDYVETFTTNYHIDFSRLLIITKYSCLSFNDLYEYEHKLPICKCLYALYLKIIYLFHSPLELKDFQIKKAPQNMMYVYDRFGNKYTLLSINPEHLKNIIDGKKIIEIRRQILNGLKDLINDNVTEKEIKQ